jgi:hypothetical protein
MEGVTVQEIRGDLLIGGLRLSHVKGELDEGEPRPDSHDWILSGRLHVPTAQFELLELDRPYRLQLDDGRAGQVIVSRIDGPQEDQVLVGFEPRPTGDGHYPASHEA